MALADWLETVSGPILVGADANTPEVDHPDADLARTHWHSGSRPLDPDEPGDDVMFGGQPRHRLRDALRRWYDDHPEEAAALRRERPEGPLAISHRTGRRNSSPGTPRRYDHLRVAPGIEVESIDYHYESAVEAGSDHALVLADLRLAASDGGV